MLSGRSIRMQVGLQYAHIDSALFELGWYGGGGSAAPAQACSDEYVEERRRQQQRVMSHARRRDHGVRMRSRATEAHDLVERREVRVEVHVHSRRVVYLQYSLERKKKAPLKATRDVGRTVAECVRGTQRAPGGGPYNHPGILVLRAVRCVRVVHLLGRQQQRCALKQHVLGRCVELHTEWRVVDERHRVALYVGRRSPSKRSNATRALEHTRQRRLELAVPHVRLRCALSFTLVCSESCGRSSGSPPRSNPQSCPPRGTRDDC